jgi:hypothetical protein
MSSQKTVSQSTYTRLKSTVAAQSTELAEMRESLDLLSQQLSQNRWIELTGDRQSEDFTLADRKTISQWAQIYYIKNPLIGLAVNLKTAFVFGNGIRKKAKHTLITEVINDFWDDNDNKAELTSFLAQQLKSNTIQLDGNVFLTLFTNPSTGHVKVSSIPQKEIEEVITHPQNRRKPLWYKRVWLENEFNYSTGTYTAGISKTMYYRDYLNFDKEDKVYDPPQEKIARDGIGGGGEEILIYHAKVNCTDEQKFGFSETYRAHDWAKAYTDFLSDLSSIWKSLSHFAWDRKLKNGTATQVARAKEATRTYNADGSATNKTPAPGSTRISNDNDNLAPIKTNGVTMSADDGRRLLLMVCAAMGVFEHYFGDGSNSNLASTSSMELPMLVMLQSRQSFWEDVYRNIFEYVIRAAAKARSGKLFGYATWEDEVNRTGKLTLNDTVADPRTGKTDISQYVSIKLPPITMRDVKATMAVLETALTLGGKQLSKTPLITARAAAEEAMTILEIDGAEEIIEELYPEGEGEESYGARMARELGEEMAEDPGRKNEFGERSGDNDDDGNKTDMGGAEQDTSGKVTSQRPTKRNLAESRFPKMTKREIAMAKTLAEVREAMRDTGTPHEDDCECQECAK